MSNARQGWRKDQEAEHLNSAYAPALSHFGVFCTNLEQMSEFYRSVFDLQVTDHGRGIRGPGNLVFLSGDHSQHHQLVLADGRAPGSPSTVMQISFKVEGLDALRTARSRAVANGAADLVALSHGNALSIYFLDPEANTVEVYVDTPWYIAQPQGDPLDLDLPDEVIWQQAEDACRADPTFMSVEEWQRLFLERAR
jgi:catechol-2,3-dioxygenase